MVAPVEVSVALPPAQTAPVPVAVTIGEGLTVIVTLAVAEQPAPEVPVTVYVVVAAGVTEMLLPVMLPGSQL